MRRVLGLLLLTMGALGAVAAYWWVWVMGFFLGQALGIVKDHSPGLGLAFVGTLAGGASGLIAGSTAYSGMGLALSPLPKNTFFLTWMAWMLLGAVLSAAFLKILSVVLVASLLAGCHLIGYVTYAFMRWTHVLQAHE